MTNTYEGHRQWLETLQKNRESQLLEHTKENLERNNMETFIAEKKEDVIPLLDSLMSPGAIVSTGGSATNDECGVIEYLRSGKYRFLDRFRTDNTEELFHQALMADCYIMSSNAVTEDGCLYNVDGRGNRLAALIYGPKRVIVIAGCNKIVRTVDDAIRRVKETAAPLNCRRLNLDTYCTHAGYCAGIDGNINDGCHANARICNSYLVTSHQMDPQRVKVILVGESLGF